MKIALNGELLELASGSSLQHVLDLAGYAQRRVAVEINREIVPRSQHGARMLADGDTVEIVHAIGGG